MSRRLLDDDVIEAQAGAMRVQDSDDVTRTYLFGPGGTVFMEWGAAASIVSGAEAEVVRLTHRLREHNRWALRFAQLCESADVEWVYPDGRDHVCTTAFLPWDGGQTEVYFITPAEWDELYPGDRSTSYAQRYAVQVMSTGLDDGPTTLHNHARVSGGAALTIAALFLARYGRNAYPLHSRLLTVVES